ncbi:MAG TPA: AMP-binding protein, partial [Polyangiaceae bacterium]
MPESTTLPLPKLTVPPTLSAAIAELANVKDDHGFVFVRPDGSELYYSFVEIHAQAVRRGAQLLAFGLQKGDRLAMVVPDGDEFVLSFLGATYVGIVPVPIYPQLSFKNIETYHDTVAHIVRASGARMLLTTPATLEYVEPVKAKVETLERFVTCDAFAASVLPDPKPTVSPDDLCFLQFTSGSTSRPKGVAVTHGNLAYNTNAFMGEGLQMVPGRDK